MSQGGENIGVFPEKSTLASPERASPSSTSVPGVNQPAGSVQKGMSVVVVKDGAALAEYVSEWENLAADALEPNVFYEPWMLMPAVRLLGAGSNLYFVLIFVPDRARPQGPPLLCGFFPFQRQKLFKGLPFSVLKLWQHRYCYLCTPLLRSGYARECLKAFFEWLSTDAAGSAVVELGSVPGEGPFHQQLVDFFWQQNSLTFTSECHTRALLRPPHDAEAYLHAAISRDHRKDLKRKERGLSEKGVVEYQELAPDGDAGAWIRAFMQLEASGWKGREGTALACEEVNQEYFLGVAEAASKRGRLLMHALHVNGRPVALRCEFISGQWSFYFKPAFDEEYARFSPGLQLEVEAVRRRHGRPEILAVDSCTRPDHRMLNDLWTDRRVIQTVLVATGRAPGKFLVSVAPLLRWLRRLFLAVRPRSEGKMHS